MENEQRPALHTLSDSINFAQQMLSEFAKKENLQVEEKVILALYRKLIEQLDGNFILADHSTDSPSKVMIRAAFETYLGIKYILLEKRRFQDRAYSYYVGSLINQQNTTKELIKNPLEEISKEQIENTMKKVSDILGRAKYKKIVDEWERTKKTSGRPYEPKWYSLFNGPTSVNQLLRKAGDKREVIFYSLLSQESHGYQALNGVEDPDLEEPLRLKSIRSSIEDANFQEELARALCTSATHIIIEKLFPVQKDEFITFGKKIGLIPKSYPYNLNI